MTGTAEGVGDILARIIHLVLQVPAGRARAVRRPRAAHAGRATGRRRGGSGRGGGRGGRGGGRRRGGRGGARAGGGRSGGGKKNNKN